MLLELEEIEDLREEWEFTLSREDYQQRIESHVASMAVGAPGRAYLFCALSESLAADDAPTAVLERAVEAAQGAIADGGPTRTDPRVELVQALHLLGREDELLTLVRECLRASTRDEAYVDLHAELGDVLEHHGRLRLAMRAYTVGLKHFEPELDEPDSDEGQCLAGRYRVRRHLDLGFDSLDRAFEQHRPDIAEQIRDAAAGLVSSEDPAVP